MFEGYKLKYRLNARHSLNSNEKNIHPHTFEILLCIELIQEEKQVAFYNVDKVVEQFLSSYQNQYLNDIPPFDKLQPTIENIGNTFYEELKVILYKEQLNLLQLEIGETPLRVYLISERLMLGSIKHIHNYANSVYLVD